MENFKIEKSYKTFILYEIEYLQKLAPAGISDLKKVFIHVL